MKSSLKIVLAMILWGSLGIFVKKINLPSMEIAFCRAFIASVIYIIIGIFSRISAFKSTKNKISWDSADNGLLQMKFSPSKDLAVVNVSSTNKDLFLLIVSGVAMGFNWVLLFQAYKMTSIANATLSYYFAPVLVVLIAPIVLGERFNFIKFVSVLASMYGLFLIITGSFDVTKFNIMNDVGILFGLAAAVLYCSVIILNKLVKGFSGIARTKIQLISSMLVLVPFIIYRNNLQFVDKTSLIYIIIIGVLHTAIAYYLYFSGVKESTAQNAAILGYIDPISALVLSFIILGESLSFYEMVGGALILGATFVVQVSSVAKTQR